MRTRRWLGFAGVGVSNTVGLLCLAAAVTSLWTAPASSQVTVRGLTIVAAEGSNGFSSFDQLPSINDSGTVAFIGRVPNGSGGDFENVFSWDPRSLGVRPLMPLSLRYPRTGDAPTQQFGPGVQINNNGDVLAWRVLFARVQIGFPFGTIAVAPLSYLERWRSTSTALPTQVQMGDGGSCVAAGFLFFLNPVTSGQLPSPFDFGTPYSLLWRQGASHNNIGSSVLSGQGNCRRNNGSNLIETFTPNRNTAALLTGLEVPKPVLADTNYTVMRRQDAGTTTNGQIFVLSPGIFPITSVAGPANGFNLVGAGPAIADAGDVLAFLGRRDGRGGAFLCFRQGSSGNSWGAPVRIAGTSGDGFLDPLEIFNDLNGNGQVDIGEDFGTFEAFAYDGRIAVNRLAGTVYAVAYIATGVGGRMGLYITWIDMLNGTPDVLQHRLVLEHGEIVAGLTGTVQEISLHDGLNNRGEIAFYVRTTSTSAIVSTSRRPVDVVDFNDPLLRQAAGDPGFLASGGTARIGFSADGSSPLLVRVTGLPLSRFGGAMARFSIRDEFGSSVPADVGGLLPVSTPDPIGASTLTSLDVPMVRLPASNELAAFALIRPPIDFVRPSLNGTPSDDRNRGPNNPRRLTLHVQALLPGQTVPLDLETREIELHRPPVVLVHGLEGFPTNFKWDMQYDPRFDVIKADYHQSHADLFVTNRQVVRAAIEDGTRRLRERQIASTKADVIGHSMGGLLTRLYMLDQFSWNSRDWSTGYLRPDNFSHGDVRRLITVSTPHFGSEVSDILVTQDNRLTRAGQIASCWTDGPTINDEVNDKRCTPCGAVRDLRTDSEIIRVINSRTIAVPSHAVVGLGTDDTLVTSYINWREGHSGTNWADVKYHARTVLGAAACGLPVSDLFGGENDLVVSRLSQEGGLTGDAVTYFAGLGSWHFPIVDREPTGNVNTRIIDLLNATSAGPLFDADGFPGGLSPHQAPPCDETILPPQSPAIEILSPVPNTVYAPGDVVAVDLMVPASAFIDQVSASIDGGSFDIDRTPPYNLTVTVPVTAVGAVEINIRGFERIFVGGIAFSFPTCDRVIPIQIVVPEAPLTSVRLDLPEPRLTFSQLTGLRYLRVVGLYADGVERNVTRAGTTFSSSDPSVASVDASGMVVANRIGFTTISAFYGGQMATVEVRVAGVRGDANSDGVIDSTDVERFSVAFSGSWTSPGFVRPSVADLDSFDFDLDGDLDCGDWTALRLRWTNSGGAPPAVAQCPTCYADITGIGGPPANPDGLVTGDDFIAFIAAFAAGELLADITGIGGPPAIPDGLITGDDFNAFIAAFASECP
jgi:pimeloyl-ACP methyl ester carboxylesterase